MRLGRFNSDFSPYFDRGGNRVVIPNDVKLVIGTKTFNCSGSILAQHSAVFLELIQSDTELYLDQFTDCLEGLLDGIDLLYGAQVTLTQHNIQPLLKFSLLYKVEGVLKACLEWVKKELSMVNLFTFYKMGMIVKSIDCEDVLKSCKEFIMTCTADELLGVSNTWSEDDNLISNTWSEDDNLIKFMLDKEMLSVTLPTVTDWVSTESRVVMVLDGIEECGLQEEMAKMSNATSELMAKMHEICEEGVNMKRVYKLQTYITFLSPTPPRPVVQLEIDSGSLLESLKPKRWREFDLDQITSLHHHYKIEDFFFAEISLDWISSTKPAQPAVGHIWDIIVQSKISDRYLVALRTSIQFYDANLDIPTVNVDIKADKYSVQNYPGSDDIQQKLTGSGSANDIHMSGDCTFKDCILESKHGKTFKLTDTIPCYQLGVEGTNSHHYHHDKVFHWYGTVKEKKGKRVMISFVTNTMAEVIERVRASENIRLHHLKLNDL